MRALRPRLATLSLASLALALACSSSSGPVQLAPTLVFPQGLLDSVTKVSLSVYDSAAGVDCNSSSGNPTGVTSGTSTVATKDLASTGCPTGVKFCGDLQLDKSSSPRVFAAQAFTGSNPVAAGCTKVTVDQDTLQVQIKMLRYLPPFMCGTQTSSVPTQCAAPGSPTDPVCDANCISKEMYLSPGDAQTTFDGKPKTRPLFVWPALSGDGGRMFGFWGEQRAGGTQVSMRVLADDLENYTGQGTWVEQYSFRLPTVPNGGIFPPTTYPFPQVNPAPALLNGSYYVAFEDGTSGPVTIKIQSLDGTLVPQANKVVSDAVAAKQSLPSLAASSSQLLAVWEDQGNIVGKTISSSLALGTQKTLGPGSAPALAATSSGWVAVFQNGTDIDMVTVDGTGTPAAPVKVNDGTHAGPQVHPWVATLANGTVAVVWLDTGASNGGNVFVQRYDTTGKAVANDQATPINDTSLGSAQATPSIAAGTNFFIATWVDTGSGHVRGRFLDGTNGFLYNSVTGQSGDFQASSLDGETRANPTAVVGGASPYVLIAWEDNAGANLQGIYGRRFPLPQ
jgi:hypothetical protein